MPEGYEIGRCQVTCLVPDIGPSIRTWPSGAMSKGPPSRKVKIGCTQYFAHAAQGRAYPVHPIGAQWQLRSTGRDASTTVKGAQSLRV
jgi:hypothetical protein